MNKQTEKSNTDPAFKKLCDDAYKNLMKYALRLRDGDIYAAEEIVNNVYMIAAEKPDILLEHPNPAGWLTKTAYDINMQYKKKKPNINRRE